MTKSSATFFLSFILVVGAQAQSLIAGWDFQTTTNGGTALTALPSTPKVLEANFGSGNLYLDGRFGSSDWLVANSSSTQVNALGGTTINTAGTDFSTITSGASALALQNVTANSNSIVFVFSMTGFSGLSISLAAERTSAGFTEQAWAWSLDGLSYNSIGSFVAGTGPGNLRDTFANTGVLSFSNISGLNNASVAYVQATFTGATTASGNNRIDNVQFNAVPEPSTYALVALAGVGLAGHLIRRRRR